MEALGLNPVLFLAQVISFLVLLAVLNKFLYKKIAKALEDRRESVRLSLDKQQEIEKRLKEIEEQNKEMRKSINLESKKVLAEARKEAEETKKQILEEATDKSKKIVAQAQDKINGEVLAAQELLKAKSVELAKEIAYKTLSNDSGDLSWQKKQLDESLKQLKSVKYAG